MTSNNKPARRRMNPQMVVGLLAGMYGVSPVDAIPDVVPVLGQADDAIVIVLAMVLILVMTVMGGNDNG